MTARTKLIVLERAHTLLVLVLGSAAAIAVLTLLEKPEGVLPQFAYMAAGLSVGYLTASLADTFVGVLVRRPRARLLAAVRKADPAV